MKKKNPNVTKKDYKYAGVVEIKPSNPKRNKVKGVSKKTSPKEQNIELPNPLSLDVLSFISGAVCCYVAFDQSLQTNESFTYEFIKIFILYCIYRVFYHYVIAFFTKDI